VHAYSAAGRERSRHPWAHGSSRVGPGTQAYYFIFVADYLISLFRLYFVVDGPSDGLPAHDRNIRCKLRQGAGASGARCRCRPGRVFARKAKKNWHEKSAFGHEIMLQAVLALGMPPTHAFLTDPRFHSEIKFSPATANEDHQFETGTEHQLDYFHHFNRSGSALFLLLIRYFIVRLGQVAPPVQLPLSKSCQ
jgi:hypothetical protein